MNTVTDRNWQCLVDANHSAVKQGWAQRGVFGTGIGPDYSSGHPNTILYVGKSAGPLGSAVGSTQEQSESIAASTSWMMERRNPSSFWQFIDLFDKSRRFVAWTNIIKMDRKSGAEPPRPHECNQVWEANAAAFCDELDSLKPRLILFATSKYMRSETVDLLRTRGFSNFYEQIDDGHTLIMSDRFSFAVFTRHPQGWPNEERKRIAAGISRLDRSTCLL